jgi:hypothetical protein
MTNLSSPITKGKKMKNVIFIITMVAVVGCYDSTDTDSDMDTETSVEDAGISSDSASNGDADAGDAGVEGDADAGDADIEQEWEMPCTHNRCYCDTSDPSHKVFRCCIEGHQGWYWGRYTCDTQSTCVTGESGAYTGCSSTEELDSEAYCPAHIFCAGNTIVQCGGKILEVCTNEKPCQKAGTTVQCAS